MKKLKRKFKCTRCGRKGTWKRRTDPYSFELFANNHKFRQCQPCYVKSMEAI